MGVKHGQLRGHAEVRASGKNAGTVDVWHDRKSYLKLNSRTNVEAVSDVMRRGWQIWFEHLERKRESDWMSA